MNDLKEICDSNQIDWNCLKDKTILVTGSTGLIGSLIVKAILLKNKMDHTNIKLILVVRSMNKAKEIFSEFDLSNIIFYESSVEDCKNIEENIHFIIHCASPTKSKIFTENPVETMLTISKGSENVLNIAKEKRIESIVNLSSMEVYGEYKCEQVCNEKDLGLISLDRSRNSYPEAKRFGELLFYSYFTEYNVPAKNIRLSQVFGPGIPKNENRVYKQFCDSILNRENIVLHSTGESIMNFCYTVDAIIGIIKVLLEGKSGETYNVAADRTDLTIKDIAYWLIQEYGNDKQKVLFELNESYYAVTNRTVLDNSKLKKLGWIPLYSIKDGYDQLLKYLKVEKDND